MLSTEDLVNVSNDTTKSNDQPVRKSVQRNDVKMGDVKPEFCSDFNKMEVQERSLSTKHVNVTNDDLTQSDSTQYRSIKSELEVDSSDERNDDKMDDVMSKSHSHLNELEIQEHCLTTKYVNSAHDNSSQSDSSQSDSSQYVSIKSELENQSSGNDDNSIELTPEEMDSSDNEEPEEIAPKIRPRSSAAPTQVRHTRRPRASVQGDLREESTSSDTTRSGEVFCLCGDTVAGLYCALHDEITGNNGKGQKVNSKPTSIPKVPKKRGRKPKQKSNPTADLAECLCSEVTKRLFCPVHKRTAGEDEMDETSTTSGNALRRSSRAKRSRTVVSCVCGQEDEYCTIHDQITPPESKYPTRRLLKDASMCLCREADGLYCPVHDVITGDISDLEQSESDSGSTGTEDSGGSSTDEDNEEDPQQSMLNIAKTLAWLKQKSKQSNVETPFTSPEDNTKLTLTDLQTYELSSKQLKRLDNFEKNRNSDRLYACDICDKVFKFRSRLKLHMVVHTKVAEYVCDQCGSAFTSSGNLKQHMAVHTNVKRFVCTFCDKRFKQSSHLKVHNLTHTGIKKHVCTVCGKRFTQMNTLKVHMDFHNGTRSYQCGTCSKKFVQRCDLQRHLATHKESKGSFSCNYCDKNFSTMDTFHQHSVIHIPMGSTKTVEMPNMTLL